MSLYFREIKALLVTLKEGEEIKPSQVIKRRIFRRYGLIGTWRDRILTAIFYGLMRKQGCVDRVIEGLLGRDIAKINPWLRAALRLVTYLRVFAYCDEISYRNLREYIPEILYHYTSDFNLIEEFRSYYDRISKAKPEDLIKRYVDPLENKYNMPRWLILKIKSVLGDEAEKFFESCNMKPPITFRVNTLKATVEEVVDQLRKEGYEVSVGEYVPVVIKVKPPFKFERSKLFKEGKIIPQDESCAAAALILDPKPGEKVVDMCAAPGGKATHMAELMRNRGVIYAFDIHEDRIRRMKWIIEKTGVKIIRIFKMSCTKAPRILGEEIADKVLLDPPCSTTGALFKYPESRWRLTLKELEDIVEKQIDFMHAAIKLVKPGGRILYTVCSVLPEEGEEIIRLMLKTYEGYIRVVKIKGPYDKGFLEGTMRAWPHRHKTTGMFYALLEKIKSLKS